MVVGIPATQSGTILWFTGKHQQRRENKSAQGTPTINPALSLGCWCSLEPEVELYFGSPGNTNNGAKNKINYYWLNKKAAITTLLFYFIRYRMSST
jgi:hypothetical protein